MSETFTDPREPRPASARSAPSAHPVFLPLDRADPLSFLHKATTDMAAGQAPSVLLTVNNAGAGDLYVAGDCNLAVVADYFDMLAARMRSINSGKDSV